MIIDGKFVENITCSICRWRHPAEISCKQAGEIADAERARVAAIDAAFEREHPAEPVACPFGCTTQEEHDAHYAAPPAPEPVDDGYCRSCDGDKCTTGSECVTLGRDGTRKEQT